MLMVLVGPRCPRKILGKRFVGTKVGWSDQIFVKFRFLSVFVENSHYFLDQLGEQLVSSNAPRCLDSDWSLKSCQWCVVGSVLLSFGVQVVV